MGKEQVKNTDTSSVPRVLSNGKVLMYEGKSGRYNLIMAKCKNSGDVRIEFNFVAVGAQMSSQCKSSWAALPLICGALSLDSEESVSMFREKAHLLYDGAYTLLLV